jgi:hypothetical protein
MLKVKLVFRILIGPNPEREKYSREKGKGKKCLDVRFRDFNMKRFLTRNKIPWSGVGLDS